MKNIAKWHDFLDHYIPSRLYFYSLRKVSNNFQHKTLNNNFIAFALLALIIECLN